MILIYLNVGSKLSRFITYNTRVCLCFNEVYTILNLNNKIMEAGTILKNVLHDSQKGKPIHEWDFIEFHHGECRVYYLKEEIGFLFYCVENIGTLNGTGWYPERTYVETLFWGSSFFDGIRHLYSGHKQTGDFGYNYYPSLKMIADGYKVLSDLVINLQAYRIAVGDIEQDELIIKVL